MMNATWCSGVAAIVSPSVKYDPVVRLITDFDSVLVDPNVHTALQYIDLEDIIGKVRHGARRMQLHVRASWGRGSVVENCGEE